jgi:FkbM family methyltransferase
MLCRHCGHQKAYTATYMRTLLLWYARAISPHRGKWKVVSWLRRRFPVAVAGEMIEKRGGLVWSLDPSDYVCEDLFWIGEKDHWELFHLSRVIKGIYSADCTFLDIGANFGYYSMVLAHTFGSHFQAYAFEPNPTVYERLVRNIGLNSGVTVHPFMVGVGDQAGTVGMTCHDSNSGTTRLDGDGDVAVTTIDAFCAQRSIKRVDVMKVDVEGFELKVLHGARSTVLRDHPVVLIEINPPLLQLHGSHTQQGLISELQSLGYDLFQLNRDRLVRVSGTPQDGTEYINYLCIHKESPYLRDLS